MTLFDKVKKNLNREQIARKLSIDTAEQKEALRRRLRAMERDGQLMFDQRKGYQLLDPKLLVTGLISIHPDGFGFVSNPELKKDLFIQKSQLSHVFNGDVVEVFVDTYSNTYKSHHKLVRIVERKTTQIVGQLKRNGKQFYLIPENANITHKIDVADNALLNAKPGQYVNTTIINYPHHRNNTLVKVVEVLGNPQDTNMDIMLALCRYNITDNWDDALIDHAEALGSDVAEKDKVSRVDYRHLPFVTIDGADAKDFDDAIYCEKTSSGDWRLMVAIADVSHYVQAEDALDIEAQQRATSIYLPGHVVPMLPEVLSNGLCSLNPKVDRLVIACEMIINKQGDMIRANFTEGLIHSQARLTYDQAYAVISKQGSKLSRKINETKANIVPHLHNLHALFEVLKTARKKRGAIDFDSKEFKFTLTNKRKISNVLAVTRNDAHRMVEEFMLCANVSTAKFLHQHKIPSLFRVHEGPKAKKITALHAFLLEKGLSLGGADKPNVHDYNQLLESIKYRSDASAIRTMLLRSQSQAEYSAENDGHFGLAYDAYAHFTSPIRRYPDLLTHRAIRAKIRTEKFQQEKHRIGMNRALRWLGLNKLSGKSLSPRYYPYDRSTLKALALHCSQQSRQAKEVSRDVENSMKCKYMAQFTGESFMGTISGVTSFGFFVALDQGLAEGLVHLSSLPTDGLKFDAGKQTLSNGTKSFVFGDKVEVVLDQIDFKQKKMSFKIAIPSIPSIAEAA